MKKRTVVALTITILVIIFTHRSWYYFKPMPVDFDIQSKGKYKIEAQLNIKDNDEFTKIKSASDIFDLDKVNHVHLEVKKSKRPKRLRIILSSLDSPNTIKIKNIKLDNKFAINNPEKRAVRGGG